MQYDDDGFEIEQPCPTCGQYTAEDYAPMKDEIDRLRRDLHAVILTACAQELGLATIEAASWTTA